MTFDFKHSADKVTNSKSNCSRLNPACNLNDKMIKSNLKFIETLSRFVKKTQHEEGPIINELNWTVTHYPSGWGNVRF